MPAENSFCWHPVLTSGYANAGVGLFAGGRVVLGNQTSLRGNTAPKSEGKTIYSVVDLSYELPAPLATWDSATERRLRAIAASFALP